MACEHLRRIGEIVGSDVLAIGDFPTAALGDHQGVWLLTCGSVDRVIPEAPFHGPDEDLVAACLPCRLAKGRYTLEDLSLENPMERAPAQRASWMSLLGVLEAPPESPHAVVGRALLLDGSTMNLAGCILGPVSAPVEACVRAGDAGVISTHPVELTSDPGGAVRFQTHFSLLDLLGASPTPDCIEVRLHDAESRHVPMTAVPGASDTANSQVVETIPVVEPFGLRAQLDLEDGVSIHVQELDPEIEVSGLRNTDEGLIVRLVPSPPGAGKITAVWLRSRSDGGAGVREVPLQGQGNSEWRLDVGGSLLPDPGVGAILWNLWATREHEGGTLDSRPGRLRSDLLLPGDAITLPRSHSRHGGMDVVVQPYITRSRHLSLNVKASATSVARRA